MNILHSINELPKSICTRSSPYKEDFEELIKADLLLEDNRIFLQPFVPIDEIYLEQHNTYTSNTWHVHNKSFANFIKSIFPSSVLEIAGGSGNLYKTYNPDFPWTLIDINPTIESSTNLNVIKKNFSWSDINNNDTVVASHFFEHVYNHEEFLLRLLDRGSDNFIISIPNMLEYLKSNFPVLHFEHPVLLTDEYIKHICSKTGWEISRVEYFKKHSIFYHLVPYKGSKAGIFQYDIKNHIEVIDSFLSYIKRRVEYLNNYQFYVFGAHFPLYFLRSFGLSDCNILGVLDNDPNKQNKRMYGLDILTHNPADIPPSKICVEMGPYTDEIKLNLSQHTFI